jgi:cytoskeletal protein RodZ
VSVGQTLQAAREHAGLTVEQVSEATRIRSSIVRSIEADDFGSCGGDFYARGHIRAIAHVVGVDSEPLVAEFDGAHTDHSPRASEVFEAEAHATPERRGPNWTAAMIVALVVVCLYGALQLFSGSQPRTASTVAGGLSGTPSTTAASSAPATSPSSTPSSTAPSSPPPVVAQAPRDSVTVAVDAVRGASWVRATSASGKVLFEGLLRKGASQELADKTQVKLVIGNAGSVDLTVNGKAIGSPGKSGDVVHVAFGPDDPAAG